MAHGNGHGHHGKGKRDLTVMTRNLYLGSSLGPALEAKTPEEFVAAVAQIYATVQYTNFPQRAEAIADEIQEEEPDLIGLQEVTKWTTGGVNPPPGYDFLAILEGELEARGLDYSVASIAHNANIGPAPLRVGNLPCRFGAIHLLGAARRSRRDPRQRRHAGTDLEQPAERAIRHSAGRSNRRSARCRSTAAGPASTRS